MDVAKLLAHRGASQFAPENTLVALEKAQQMGATWVEFDVKLTRDKKAIIFHDARLDRTTNGDGRVALTRYKVIKELDAGSWFAPEFAGERVPTLEQYIKKAAELGLGVNIEMKASGKRKAHLLTEQIFIALNRYWSDDLPAPLISSQYRQSLLAVRRQHPSINLGYISDTWSRKLLHYLEEYQCQSLHINHVRLVLSRVDMVKQRGFKVLAYTVNDKQRAEELYAMGVDGIFSDNPELMK